MSKHESPAHHRALAAKAKARGNVKSYMKHMAEAKAAMKK